MTSDPYDFLKEDLTVQDLFEYVDSRYYIHKSGFSLIDSDSQVYYKMRHNVFKTIVSYYLGISSTVELPFHTTGLITSNRTPDFLLVDQDNKKILLIEYTVTNQFATAVTNKESFGKYDLEVAELRELGYSVDDYYLCLTLDTDINDLYESVIIVSKNFTDTFVEDLYQHLSSLKDDFFYLNWYINDHIPQLLSNETTNIHIKLNSNKLKFETPFKTIESPVSKKSKRNIFIKRKVKSKLHNLSKSFSRKARNLRYKLVYNVSSDTLYTQFDEDGLEKSHLLNLIQTQDEEIFDLLDVRGGLLDIEEPFKKYGSNDFNYTFEDRLPDTNMRTEDNNYTEMLPRRLQRITHTSLVDNKLEEIYKTVPSHYRELMECKNSSSDNILIIKKNPFIFVPTRGVTKEGEQIRFRSTFALTNEILFKSRKIKGTPSTFINRNIDYDQVVDLESKSSKLWSIIKGYPNVRKYIRHAKNIEYNFDSEQQENIDEFLLLREKFSKALREDTRTQYSNRITFELSRYKLLFPLEMEHYSKDKKKIIINGDEDTSILLKRYQDLIDNLFLIRGEMTSDQVYSDTKPQGLKLSENCTQMKEFLDIEMNAFRRTDMAHTLQLYSNMCYSLMYYSSIKLNKNDFCVDTLGYKNVMLIVKGGKKISSSKRSRLFKLIIPVDSNIIDIVSTKSIEQVTIDGKSYIIMPWRQLKQDYLKVGFEIYANFSNYFVSSIVESELTRQEFIKYSSIKILSLFSQKRKMEIWLSNLRYLFFNSTGQYSDVKDLVESMVEFNYDSYFYLLQNLFCDRYERLFENSQDGVIYDFFWDCTYTNFDMFSEKFDEAVFMTKSPVDNYNEHLLNLRTILESHEYFCNNFSSLDPYDILKESAIDMTSETLDDDLYKNDFMFDPKLCYLVGEDCSQMILNSANMSDIKQKFSSILSDSYTDVKTSKGMRSDIGEFWGQKGFDVIFSDIKFTKGVKDLIKGFPYSTRNEFESEIRKLDTTFLDKLNSIDLPDLQFDVKDKIGPKGRREIYVMTLNSKIIQQPIERLMKYLCTLIPNELINKKSHIRPKIIHQKIFESTEADTKTIFLTLDCRKWAPRSNLWKYVYFIMGMSSVLPVEFINYFLQVWFLMFHKKVRVQSHYVDILNKNSNTKNLTKYLVKRQDEDYELNMPYSFMMGIYNYLSSLFHAATQNYFNKYVASTLNTHFNLFAHSDDSGGTITYKNLNNALRSFRYYEHFQKACNHLLSKKKSVISHSSFEIISIMYSNKRFIPVTYKFITNVSFNPTGAGWYSDICSTVSLIVDIFQNGGSYLQCYSALLTHVELLRKAYHLPRSDMLSSIPLHFGGIFNMHPIHLILLGSAAQEVMLDVVESKRARDHRIHMYYLFNGEYVPGRGSDLQYRLPYIVKHTACLELDDDESQIIRNLSLFNERRTMFDAIKYYNDLRKTKFEYSLLNVDTYKLLYSTLFFKTKVLRTGGSNDGLTITDLAANFMGFQILGEFEKSYFEPYSNEYSYMSSSESISIDFNANTIASKKSCKPMLYNTFMNLGLNLSYDDVCHLILHNSGEEYRLLNKNIRKWESLSEYFSDIIPGNDRQEKLRILSKLERADISKLRSAHLFIPSNVTIDTPERFWTYSMLMCSRKYFISTQKPQFYTLEQFEFWKLPYECLKHHYFLLKLAMSDKDFLDNYSLYESSINSCDMCESKGNTRDSLKEILKIIKCRDYDNFTTNMPFAIYKRPQMKGQTAWYGTSDFALYSRFGRVEHYITDGTVHTDFFLYDNNMLDQIWHLYKIFCDSRGITKANVIYSSTGEQSPRVAFSDLNMPYTPKLHTFTMVLSDSRIYLSDYLLPVFKKVEGKVYFEDEPVDFNIYNVCDINDSFYNKHKLELLRDLFISKITSINEQLLINSFKSSKLYNIISLDDFHRNNLPLYKKYVNIPMLGAPGSFTRALCMANEVGLVSYKSSVSPGPVDLGVLEKQNISQVPIIDLYNSSSMLRVNQFDYMTLLKLANNEDIDSRDISNLENLIFKCGLSTGINLMVQFKEILKNFDSSVLVTITPDIKIDILTNIFQCIHKAMDDFPSRKLSYQFKHKKSVFWNTLKSLDFQRSFDHIATLIVRGLFRAQSDDLRVFWSEKKKNNFTLMMNIHHFAATNLFMMISNMLKDIKRAGVTEQLIANLNNLKYYLKAKPIELPELFEMDIDSFEVDETIYHDLSNYDIGETFINPDDDDYDDDLDAVNENDELNGNTERIYSDDFEELKVILHKNNQKALLSEYTITHQFKKVQIMSPGDFYNANWLGPGNFYSTVVDGIALSVSEYPGSSICPPPISNEKGFYRYKKRDDLAALDEEAKRLKNEKEKSAKETIEEILDITLGKSIANIFREHNLLQTRYIQKIVPKDAFSLSELFGKVIDVTNFKTKNITRRAARNYLPGFTGVLRDKESEGELNSIFGANHIYIYGGQVKVSKSTGKTIKLLIRNLFHKVSNDHKALLTFILSILKETIEGESDSWFTDKIFSILDDIDSNYGEIEDEKVYIAPEPGDFSIFSSQYTYTYEAYDDVDTNVVDDF
jgi:hypothetical protein